MKMSDQETMFRTTMAAAQVGIFVLQDQRFKFVNPFLAGLLGKLCTTNRHAA